MDEASPVVSGWTPDPLWRRPRARMAPGMKGGAVRRPSFNNIMRTAKCACSWRLPATFTAHPQQPQHNRQNRRTTLTETCERGGSASVLRAWPP